MRSGRLYGGWKERALFLLAAIANHYLKEVGP